MIYTVTLVFDSEDDDTRGPEGENLPPLNLEEVSLFAENLNIDVARTMRCYQGFRVNVEEAPKPGLMGWASGPARS